MQRNGCPVVDVSDLNSLVHKLLHASDVYPMGRTHLFHLRKALRGAKNAHQPRAWLGGDARAELTWWSHQLSSPDTPRLPLASRFGFPSSSPDTIVDYADASREERNPSESGFGAWAVVLGTFVYIVDRWTAEEVRRYSINVLEAHSSSVCSRAIIEHARSLSCPATHLLAFIDNSSAENVAEFGRTQRDGLHAVNAHRLEWNVALGVSQASERVASVDNDVADLLSRGRVEEALRFPSSAGLPIVQLHLSPALRSTEHVPPTWA